MNTKILPQIAKIEAAKKPLLLESFFLDKSVTEEFKRAEEVFDDISLSGKCPIAFEKSDMADEEYKISAKAEKIEIYAASSRGLMYALFTISELYRVNNGKLTEFTAEDKPSLPLRGLSDDISRGQISTIDNFFFIIRRLARYKYNTYMPYIEDVFAYATVGGWGKYSDPVKKDEWRVIVEYAASWNMDVRPIVNLLGHFDKPVVVEELQDLALRNAEGELTTCLDPRKPQVREVIKNILDELVDCFGKGVLHCGGDEPVDLPKVLGKEEAARQFVSHYSFICEECKKRGCTMMMYCDFFAPPWGDYAVPIEQARELPPETQFVFWDYATRPQYPYVDQLHDYNLQMYISPGSWSWKRFAPDIRLCFSNTKGLLSADRGRSLGMIMSNWADGGDTLRELAWPGAVVGANFCWAPSSDYSYDEFYEIFHKSFYGLDKTDAQKLEKIYHYDYAYKRDDEHEMVGEMWRDPYEPVGIKDKDGIEGLLESIGKANAEFSSVEPCRNVDAFNALRLGALRAEFTAMKVDLLPKSYVTSMEEGEIFANNADLLADMLVSVKQLHRKLWFDTNRESEWTRCEARYDDLYDQLHILARDLRTRLYFIKTRKSRIHTV